MKKNWILAGLILLVFASLASAQDITGKAPNNNMAPDTSNLLALNVATTRPIPIAAATKNNGTLNIRVITTSAEAAVQANDQVLVFRSAQPLRINLPYANQSTDGRELVIKLDFSGERVVLEGSEFGTIQLMPGNALTLVNSVMLNKWLVIGKI